MVVIINYGMGNLHSVYTQCKRIGFKTLISSKKSEIIKADKLILPGVGHFSKGMEKLIELDLIEVLSKKVLRGQTPILGICLGMQLFGNKSEEGNAKGLGWIEAETVKFKSEINKDYKIPHMGWNNLITKKKSNLISGVDTNDEFYFVHSYHLRNVKKNIILGITNYGYPFVSVIQKNNIYGTQFHPEKSHNSGLKILNNFLEL